MIDGVLLIKKVKQHCCWGGWCWWMIKFRLGVLRKHLTNEDQHCLIKFVYPMLKGTMLKSSPECASYYSTSQYTLILNLWLLRRAAVQENHLLLVHVADVAREGSSIRNCNFLVSSGNICSECYVRAKAAFGQGPCPQQIRIVRHNIIILVRAINTKVTSPSPP